MNKHKKQSIDQQSLIHSDYRRGQIDACEVLAEYFFDLRKRGQQFLKTEQIAQLIQTITQNQ